MVSSPCLSSRARIYIYIFFFLSKIARVPLKRTQKEMRLNHRKPAIIGFTDIFSRKSIVEYPYVLTVNFQNYTFIPHTVRYDWHNSDFWLSNIHPRRRKPPRLNENIKNVDTHSTLWYRITITIIIDASRKKKKKTNFFKKSRITTTVELHIATRNHVPIKKLDVSFFTNRVTSGIFTQ